MPNMAKMVIMGVMARPINGHKFEIYGCLWKIESNIDLKLGTDTYLTNLIKITKLA